MQFDRQIAKLGANNKVTGFLQVIIIMSKSKKRNYDESYLDFGFSYINKQGVQLPQCVLCMKTLGNGSMKPNQLKQHLTSQHPEYAEKERAFFEAKERQLKRARLDTTGAIHQQTHTALEASYFVSYRIAKEKKPHTVGETLIKPCMLECAKLVLGEAASRKLADIALSNDTVRSRIDELSLNIKSHLLEKVKDSPMFAIQLDETTDIANLSQLMVCVRYVSKNAVEEDFLFCKPLLETTTAADIMQLISKFFEKEELDWGKLVGVCTDGAPAMLGCRSGFVELVKKKNPLIEGTHCFIHREALAARTLPQSMKDHLSTAIKAVNYIKGSALNTRLFNKLCKDVNASHFSVLFHTEVRWLSKGNMLARFFELRSEILDFLNIQKKNSLSSSMTADEFEPTLAYLVDIFSSLNELNQKLQGRDKNVLTAADSISAFKDKLKLWHSRVNKGNFLSFPNLNKILENKEQSVPSWLSESISGHLVALKDEFSKYFPKLDANKEILRDLARDPYKRCVEEIPEEFQEEFLELYNDSTMKDEFGAKSVEEFWVSARRMYPNISYEALRILVQFSSTYLCEAGFSTLVGMKTKARNKLDVAADLRCALSRTTPSIPELVKNKQQQRAH